jgi:hypothetical protein
MKFFLPLFWGSSFWLESLCSFEVKVNDFWVIFLEWSRDPVIRISREAIFFLLNYFYFTSARIRMPKYWIHAKNKIFKHPLFMNFLDVIEVPEHDKAIKNLVSVCLCVCLCFCVSVCHHDYSTFPLYYRGRDGVKIFVISVWWTD